MIFTAVISSLTAGFGAGALSIFGLGPVASQALVQIGKGLLYLGASRLLAPKQSASRQEVQAVTNQATAGRVRGYGEALLGGVRAFFESSDGKLHQIIVAHHGPVSDVLGFVIDGDVANLDEAGVAQGTDDRDWRERITIDWRDGVGAGGDYTAVQSAFSFWTEDHELWGQATFYVRMDKPSAENFSKVFPKGANTIYQMIAQLSEVYDPRTEVTAYSRNPALCIMDYLTHPDGMRIPSALVNEASFSAFADMCDVSYALERGGTEPRYELCGTYSLEAPPKDILSRMLSTCAAQTYMDPDGKIAILGGDWSEPDVTITDDDILSMDLEFGVDPFKYFNVLKGIYTSADHRYTDQECQELRDAAALLLEPEKVETLAVDMCPSPSQMQRLLKIFKAMELPEVRGQITTNLVGMKARYPKGDGIHTIRVVSAVMGLDQVFLVRSHDYSVADGSCIIGIQSIENGWAWDAATEEGPVPPALDDLARPDGAAALPTGLTLSQAVVPLSSTVNAVEIIASVSDPDRDDLRLMMEYQKDGDTEWTLMNVPATARKGRSGPLTDGAEYTVRAYWLGEGADVADYPSDTITVISNPVTPDAPSNLSVVAAGGGVDIEWQNGEAGFSQTRIYRSDDSVFSNATLIDTESGVAGNYSGISDAPGAGSWWYWAVTINASLVESAETGPASITI